MICEIVESLKERHRWNDEQTAEALGISQSTINRMLHFDQHIKVSTLDKMSRGMGLTAIDFLQLHPRYHPKGHVREFDTGWAQVITRARKLFSLPRINEILSDMEEAERLGIRGILRQNTSAAIQIAKTARRAALRANSPA